MVTTVVTNGGALRTAASRLPSTFLCWLTRYSTTFAQLRRVLTAPQAVIAFKAREALKDVLLGREEGEA